MTEIQEVSETKTEVTSNTKFGLGQINKPTPSWANWAFRIYLYTASFAMLVLASLPAKRISPDIALEFIQYIAVSLVGVHGLSRLVGVDIKKDEEDAREIFTKP